MSLDFKKISQQFETPLYIYDADKIKENFFGISELITFTKNHIYFAVMCNRELEILKIIKSLGLGVQVNSEHELDLVNDAGFNSSDISFTTTGISKELMKRLINENIEVNLDSVEEVEKYCLLTTNKNFGIRIKISEKIKINSNSATNLFSGSNVGIEEKDFNKVIEIAKKTGNKITGVHGYFASNVLDTELFIEFGDFLTNIASGFSDLEYINFSSGFGIKYSEEDKDFDFEKVLKYYSYLTNKLSEIFKKEIILKIEPGRSLLANAGTLLVKVTNIKSLNSKKSEISINAGFGELARPKIYKSFHEIENLVETGKSKRIYDIRGNTALQDDFLGRNIELEEINEGDFLLIHKVGAYGFVMASGFPGKKLPMQILVNGNEIKILSNFEKH